MTKDKGGKCAQPGCKRTGAYWRSGVGSYYCGPCARELNRISVTTCGVNMRVFDSKPGK